MRTARTQHGYVPELLLGLQVVVEYSQQIASSFQIFHFVLNRSHQRESIYPCLMWYVVNCLLESSILRLQRIQPSDFVRLFFLQLILHFHIGPCLPHTGVCQGRGGEEATMPRPSPSRLPQHLDLYFISPFSLVK